MCKIEFEKNIARCCGPAMAGIKPAALISCKPVQKQYINSLKESMAPRGITVEILCEDRGSILVLVYRAGILEQHLDKPESQIFLQSFGYEQKAGVEIMIDTLKQRMMICSFPHEIGIFLGYAAEDVEGFIRCPESCCHRGAWKIYKYTQEKITLFERYDKCARKITERVISGHPLSEIFACV